MSWAINNSRNCKIAFAIFLAYFKLNLHHFHSKESASEIEATSCFQPSLLSSNCFMMGMIKGISFFWSINFSLYSFIKNSLSLFFTLRDSSASCSLMKTIFSTLLLMSLMTVLILFLCAFMMTLCGFHFEKFPLIMHIQYQLHCRLNYNRILMT